MLLCNLDTIASIKNSDIDELKYAVTPDKDKWRISFIQELLNIRHGILEAPGMTHQDITDILDDICIS